MPAGAPKGNKNAASGKRYREALNYVLVRYDNPDYPKWKPRNALEKVVAAQLKNAIDGSDNVAINAIADRLDGKPHASVDVSHDVGTPKDYSGLSEFNDRVGEMLRDGTNQDSEDAV